MIRRTFLQSLAFGTVSAFAGCLDGEVSLDGVTSVSETGLNYPSFSAAYYEVTAHQVGEPENAPIPFEDLSFESRIELVNAISRDQFVSGQPPSLLQADLHREAISYRGSPFGISIGVADTFHEPEHGPDADPDWIDPVEFTSSVEGDELTLTITNELDAQLIVYHYGRPYFGVLIAVAETSSILDHEHYKENEYIQTSDPITTERIRGEKVQTESLSPEASLRESYTIPDDLPSESAIWLSVPIGDDSIDLFGNRSIIVTARLTLET